MVMFSMAWGWGSNCKTTMQYRKDSKTSISYNISRTRLRTGIESEQVDNIGTTKKRPLFQVNIRYD